ncbi:hypothetical protein AAG570_010219 [Ranatra chinensis]|uniref:Peroxisomal membrane protein 11C n=1 Tax=Ranatra chinensis TaxID=642074 RepID=A0ABD0Z036_9HEMI
MALSRLAELLESYGGRDRVIRLFYYGTQFAAGALGSGRTADKLILLSDHLSNCRTILRLFDDLPMLASTLSYGFGPKGGDIFLRLCNVLSNSLDQLYYPLEHVAWAADLKLLPVQSSENWWTASTLCWALSSYISAINYSVQNYLMRHEAIELLTALRCGLDFIIAVHWLPEGSILWSSRLTRWQLGLLGLVSSVISLYQTQ